MSGNVARALTDRLDQLLREHRVVVWYDPERAFPEFVENLSLGSLHKISFDGSYLDLRRRAGEITGHLPDRGDGENLLVFVPADPLPEEDDLLAPLEELGCRFEESLARVAWEALEGTDVAANVKEWTSRSGMTVERLDELAESKTDTGALATVFGSLGPRELLFRFLRDERYADDIEQHHLLQDLRVHVRSVLGVEFQENLKNAHEARDYLAQRVLLTEFVHDLGDGAEFMDRFGVPEDGSAVSACRDLADRLRDDRRTAEKYRAWANTTEQKFGLAGLDIPSESLGRRDTFPFEDDRAFEHTVELAQDGGWEEALAWANQRRDGFWSREGRGQRWRAACLAAELKLAVDQERGRVPTSGDPEEWVGWYTGTGGGWRIDRMSRRLESLMAEVAEGHAIEEMAREARRHASRLESDVAEEFVDAVSRHPEALGDLPAQMDVVQGEVRPLLDAPSNGTVVFVLADALRYEMGRELAETLSEFGEAEPGYAVACAPTLTKVGMAALVPGAEAGLELLVDGGELLPRVQGQILRGVPDRVARFRAEFGSRVLDLTVEEGRNLHREDLKERLADVDLVLLRSQEIDQAGETDSLYHARTMLQHAVPGLKNALRRLATAGAEHFVVVADHGFLMRDDISEGHKLDLPSGEVLESHRRCVAGRDLGGGDGYVILSAGDLGLGGDLDLAFPRGTNVFKVAGGNTVYFHGGLSLQELIVPVVRYHTSPPEPERSEPKVRLDLEKATVTNRFFGGTLSYQASDLFDQDVERLVRIDAFEDDKPAGTLVDSRGEFDQGTGELWVSNGDTFSVTLQVSEHVEGEGTLELRVTDVESGEVVVKKEVDYELAF